ncbi:dihydrolipoyl dehydrogenase [Endothiovibrio diazotrophicus]
MARDKQFDVVVIGAGPAGYVAAIRCAQLGLKTACVDDWFTPQGEHRLGGTCLNVGCIPSKALLESSELYEKIAHQAADHGIRVDPPTLDLDAMHARKARVVESLTDGIATLFKGNGITTFPGRGRLLANKRVEVTPRDGEPLTLAAEAVILATGSHPMEIATAPVDNDRIVDSSGALAFSEVPKRLGVIGAGVIGLELGSIWKRLGSEVVILEAQGQFLPMADQAIAAEAERRFRQQGLDIRLGARVTTTRPGKQRISVNYLDKEGEQRLAVDRLLVAVGRRPNSGGIAAAEAGLLINEGGYVHVDEQCRTNLPGVYAVGDLVRGPMLAHKGSEEGVAVAECIAGLSGAPLELDHIPSVIYTDPEIAWVGRTEQSLKGAGIPYKVGRFPFAANGRARAMEAGGGCVKVLSRTDDDRLLGVHVIGPGAAELIAEATLALAFEGSAEDLARTVHAHPTLAEALKEAALDAEGRALHTLRRPR